MLAWNMDAIKPKQTSMSWVGSLLGSVFAHHTKPHHSSKQEMEDMFEYIEHCFNEDGEELESD
jgi:hypothetical protein